MLLTLICKERILSKGVIMMYKLFAVISSLIVIPSIVLVLTKIYRALESAFKIGDIRAAIAIASLGILVLCLCTAFGTFIRYLLDCAKRNKR